MKRVFVRGSLALFLLSAFTLLFLSLSAEDSPTDATQSSHGEKLQVAGVNNAGKINEHLFRGAQPTASGFAELKKLGVTMVVDLRRGNRDAVNWEREQTEAQGMRFLNIPVGGFSAPSDQQLVEFLSLFRNQPNEKVFVHCYYGDDRTGVFVASYRMVLDKWSASQAIHEMYYFGFNGRWQPFMKKFVRGFPAHLATSPPFTQFKTDKPLLPSAESPQ
jgi:tyrosine-protein phosphatase SIW14